MSDKKHYVNHRDLHAKLAKLSLYPGYDQSAGYWKCEVYAQPL
jgi:hypothetical protein